MKAYGHGELNTKQFTDVKYIQQRIDNHFDVFSDVKLKKVEIDDSYPRYIKDNIEKFRKFIV